MVGWFNSDGGSRKYAYRDEGLRCGEKFVTCHNAQPRQSSYEFLYQQREHIGGTWAWMTPWIDAQYLGQNPHAFRHWYERLPNSNGRSTHSHLKRSQSSRFDPLFGSVTHGRACLLRWLNCVTRKFAFCLGRTSPRTHNPDYLFTTGGAHAVVIFEPGPYHYLLAHFLTPYAFQYSKPTPRSFTMPPFCLPGKGDSLIRFDCSFAFSIHGSFRK